MYISLGVQGCSMPDRTNELMFPSESGFDDGQPTAKEVDLHLLNLLSLKTFDQPLSLPLSHIARDACKILHVRGLPEVWP